MNKDLEHRSVIKKKKPNFIRQDAHKKKRVGTSWRRAKGIQSKVRLNKRGYVKSVSQGYRSPKSVRGTTPSGSSTMMRERRIRARSTSSTPATA